MNKIPTLESQLLHLQKIQSTLYQAIERRQKQLQQNLQQRSNKYHCQIDRSAHIKSKNLEEQITRPVNKEISSMLLETCIRNLMDDNLDDIRSRQLQRRIERNQLREDILGKSAEYEGDSMQMDQKGKTTKSKKVTQKQKQIPWKLMRTIRQQDVQQNKRILERQRYDKLNKIRQKYT